jgi:hypothetical protein
LIRTPTCNGQTNDEPDHQAINRETSHGAPCQPPGDIGDITIHDANGTTLKQAAFLR